MDTLEAQSLYKLPQPLLGYKNDALNCDGRLEPINWLNLNFDAAVKPSNVIDCRNYETLFGYTFYMLSNDSN